MADVEFRDLSGTPLVQFTRGWAYGWDWMPQPNVASDETPGGLVYTSKRGPTRRVLTLPFPSPRTKAEASQLRAFVTDYADRAKAFLLHLAGAYGPLWDGTWAFDGTTLFGGDARMRMVGRPKIVARGFGIYEWSVTLVEDLG